MKRLVLVLLLAAGIIVLPKIVSAGFSSGNITVETRLEVSKDNATWVNYTADSNSGNQTLTVSPGDTLFFRLNTWNTGIAPAAPVTYTASVTNPSYLVGLDPFHAGTNDNLDGDGIVYTLSAPPDMTDGTLAFTLGGVAAGSTENSNDQSGQMVATVAANTPDQTVFIGTVQVSAATEPVEVTLLNKLNPKVYADALATTQVRILVSNPAPGAVPASTPPTVAGFRGK